MRITPTAIDGLVIIEPNVFKDQRGYFFESYSERKYRKKGISTHFVQDNESMSQAGVLRGLHYQSGEFAQAKLVRVIRGAVWDVAVDIRTESPTYGEWYGLELSAANKKQLYIAKGFAHGFLVLEPNTIFSYKCDNFYNQNSEGGIYYDDEKLGIGWPELEAPLIISEKDKQHPAFGEHKNSGIIYE